MIKGALYKKRTDENNYYGYDFVKVLDVKVSRVVEWTPKSEKNKNPVFWRNLPNGDIHKIIHTDYDFVVYFYNSKKRKNEILKSIDYIDREEFFEGITMCYDLVSLDET